MGNGYFRENCVIAVQLSELPILHHEPYFDYEMRIEFKANTGITIKYAEPLGD